MAGYEENFSSGGRATRGTRSRRRDAVARHRRAGGYVVLTAAAAIVLAACGSGSPSPRVANLGRSITSGGTGQVSRGGRSGSATAAPGSTPTRILDEWASCMRAHGDPNQAVPTIDTNGIIHITWNPAIPGGYEGTNQGGQGDLGPGQFCRQYLSQAQTALQSGQTIEMPTGAQLVKFAECMRANGIPDYPDPVDGNLSINQSAGGDLNPDDPAFQNASKVCVQKTGAHVPGPGGSPPPGTIELNGVAPPGVGGSSSGG